MPKLRLAAGILAVIAINCSDNSHLSVVADAGSGGGTSPPMVGGAGGALQPTGTGGSSINSGVGGATSPTSSGGSSMSGGAGGASTATGTGGASSGSGGSAGSVAFGGAGAGGSRADAFTPPESDRDASNGGAADGSRFDGRDGSELSVRDAAVSDNPVKRDGEASEATPGGICSEVPCLAVLFAPCQPSGQCRTNTSQTGDAQTDVYCYSNGVTQRQVVDRSGDPLRLIFSEALNGVLCFTIEATATGVTSGSVTADYLFRDGAGNQVATGIFSSQDSTLWVTCNGGAPAQLSTACENIASQLSGCDTGPCEF